MGVIIFAEPAPYSLPPVDLFGWKILLFPKDVSKEAGGGYLIVRQVDPPGLWLSTPISWADKQFEVQ